MPWYVCIHGILTLASGESSPTTHFNILEHLCEHIHHYRLSKSARSASTSPVGSIKRTWHYVILYTCTYFHLIYGSRNSMHSLPPKLWEVHARRVKKNQFFHVPLYNSKFNRMSRALNWERINWNRRSDAIQ